MDVPLCPREVLVFSEKFNAKGYHPPVAAEPERCLDCNLCEIVCPEFAIFTDREEEPEADEGGG